MKKYILFYSDRCVFSTKIKTALENLPIFSNIHLFLIDDQIELVPDSITRVPTLVVSVTEKYIGEKILEWANNMSVQETKPQTHTQCLLSEPMQLSPLSTMDYTFISSNEEDQVEKTFENNSFSLIDSPQEAMRAYKRQQQSTGSKKCTEKDYENYLKKRQSTCPISQQIRK